MKKLLFVLFVSMTTFLTVQAQTKQENIKVLFQLMQTDSVVDKMMNSMIPMLLKTVPQPQDTAATNKMNAMMTKMTNVMRTITNRLLNEDMTVLYDKYFTEAEIKGLVSFYQSSAGKKMISVTPELNKEMVSILLTKYVPELDRMMKN